VFNFALRILFKSFFKKLAFVLFGLSCLITALFFSYKPIINSANEGKNRNSYIPPVTKLDAPPSSAKDNHAEVLFAKIDQSDESGLDSTVLPREWEEPLFEILGNTSEAIDSRNQQLMELAINHGKHQPKVQKECLSHLLYGLSDGDLMRFTSIVTNPAIPIEMRIDFLNETFNLRPAELNEPLAKNLLSHPEGQINNLARLYLIDLNNSHK
jgi:hypothetical protein